MLALLFQPGHSGSVVYQRKGCEAVLMLVEGQSGSGGSGLQLLWIGVARLHPPRTEVPQRPR